MVETSFVRKLPTVCIVLSLSLILFSAFLEQKKLRKGKNSVCEREGREGWWKRGGKDSYKVVIVLSKVTFETIIN